MTALVPWRPPEREPIRATRPHEECDAHGCDGPVQADGLWHDERGGALHLLRVCGRCVFLLRGRGPVVFMPLGTAPPLEYVVHLLEQEAARRQAAWRAQQQVRVTFVGNGFQGWYGGTGTSTGGTFTWGTR